MRTLNCFVSGAALLLGLGLFGCVPDPTDPFETLTTATNPTVGGDGDGDETGTGTGDGDGDGDGDPTTTGDGDGDNCPAGTFGCPCNAGACDAGLECQADDTCGFPSGDGDGDGDVPCTSGWDPNMCDAPAMSIGVMGIEGGFCACPCAADADCPAGPPGTQPACALTVNDPNVPEWCALICMPPDPMDPNAMDACPEGSTCKEVPNQPGVGLCTFP